MPGLYGHGWCEQATINTAVVQQERQQQQPCEVRGKFHHTQGKLGESTRAQQPFLPFLAYLPRVLRVDVI